MGPTAKAGLLCAMFALMAAGQLLEKELGTQRRAALEEKKRAPQPYSNLIGPLPQGELPSPKPGTPPPPPGASAGASASAGAGASSGGSRTAPDGSTVYVVQQGDTLAKIAKKHYGTEGALDLIAERNKKTLPDPAKLQVGMTLHIPAREKPATR